MVSARQLLLHLILVTYREERLVWHLSLDSDFSLPQLALLLWGLCQAEHRSRELSPLRMAGKEGAGSLCCHQRQTYRHIFLPLVTPPKDCTASQWHHRLTSKSLA